MRVIDQDGEQRGVLAISEAVNVARDAGLDLVEVAPTSKPPVCRVMDYGKYQFEQNKKKSAAKKKQKQIQIKEIKFRPTTEQGDYEVKLRNLIRFLEEGNKAKVTVRFRGREMAHREQGQELLQRVREDLDDYGTVEQMPKNEGRIMTMVVAPLKKKT